MSIFTCIYSFVHSSIHSSIHTPMHTRQILHLTRDIQARSHFMHTIFHTSSHGSIAIMSSGLR